MLAFLHEREAQPASPAWNVAKTLLEMVVLWAIGFVALPLLCYELEAALGLTAYRFAALTWRVLGWTLLVLGSALHVVSDVVLAVQGEGTPSFFDCPRKLVIAGPNRYVRNPMAVAWLAQGGGVALILGSPLVLAYFLAAGLVENFIIRPWEESELERRFGEVYQRYRRRVRCWRPRFPAYDSAREAEEPPLAAERTAPPGRTVVLYDGLCRFCTAGAKKLLAVARPGSVELLSFQEPGILEAFPGISFAACMRQMHLVNPEGKVFAGVEAAVRAVATRPLLGLFAYAYYLPGFRLACDLLYTQIAANRYRLLGKAVASGECPGGTCALHSRGNSRSSLR
jgi:protein-S-isoprenylcysteine O-methyltransferase Ste14/predicted DCC family thiol-disulfide oxidoreductase YuxK